MRFTQFVIIGSAAALIASGCAGPVASEPVGPPAAVTEEAAPEIQGAEDFSIVEFTIPREFVLEETEEEIAANLDARGYIGYVVNDDQSVTYTMLTTTRDRQLQGLRDSVDLIITQTITLNPEVFLLITYDTELANFDVTVNRAAYEAQEEPSPIADILGLQGMFYQLFMGVAIVDQEPVLINFIDVATDETFSTVPWVYEG